MLVSDQTPDMLCRDNPDLFFSPDEDARTEIGRAARERMCKKMCHSCPVQLRCLEAALVNREYYGVWGGMGEGERRDFKVHLRSEGYSANEVPHGLELYASVKQFELDQSQVLALAG